MTEFAGGTFEAVLREVLSRDADPAVANRTSIFILLDGELHDEPVAF